MRFLAWIVDTLAVRYGWTKYYIFEELYWEELWEVVQVAANSTVYEKNQDLFFNFCLHAGSKDAIKNWKDSPLPFPDKEIVVKKLHYGGLDQLPGHVPVKRVSKKEAKQLKAQKNGK